MQNIASASAAGGQAAPAPAKQQPGSAAPARTGTPAGSPSTPPLEDALVAEKKKAEHWRQKYERDVGAIKADYDSRIAKLEGLAQGLSTGQPSAPKPSPKTFGDLDRTALSEIVKRGLEEGNSEYILSTVEELAERIAAKKADEVGQRAQRDMEHTLAKRQVAAKINTEFGPDVQNEESDLRRRADALVAQLTRADPQLIERNPDVLYLCFAQAERELRAGDKSELEELRKSRADALAREEIARSHQAIASKAKTDVQEILSGDSPTKIKDALRARISWLRPPS